MLTVAEAERRVENGVARLNESQPGWWNSINLELLRMAECRTCILGQLHGLYEHGLSALNMNWNSAIEHGFGLAGDVTAALRSWRTLESAWIAAIRRLQAPVELPTVRSQQPTPEYAIAK